jgi:hypothetical protein
MNEYKYYIPETVDDIDDLLTLIFYKSPTFRDTFLVHRNVDTIFAQLSEGLQNIRKEIGEERHALLTLLSARAREHFEADPEDANGQSREGRKLVREMQTMLKE